MHISHYPYFVITAKWIFPVCTVSSRACWLRCPEPNDNRGLSLSFNPDSSLSLKTGNLCIIFLLFCNILPHTWELKTLIFYVFMWEVHSRAQLEFSAWGLLRPKSVWVKLDSYLNGRSMEGTCFKLFYAIGKDY